MSLLLLYHGGALGFPRVMLPVPARAERGRRQYHYVGRVEVAGVAVSARASYRPNPLGQALDEDEFFTSEE